MKRTIWLSVVMGTALIALFNNLAPDATSQISGPPRTHTEQLGGAGLFTAFHQPGFTTPFNKKTGCTFCHGSSLKGLSGFTPSCFTCHGAFWDPTQPQYPDSHTVGSFFMHGPGRATPFASGCTLCHGQALDGIKALGPSCFSCHGEVWQPPNQRPAADPNGTYAGTVGQPVQFDGSGSSDPDGTIVAYDWDFGDGGRGTGMISSHAYAAAGNYAVTLGVTDNAGASASAQTTATIQAALNQRPVAHAGGPYSGSPGQPVQFDGSGSRDPDGTIVAYLWDFGDGGVGMGSRPTHAYAAAGTYTATLTVMDDVGGMGTATATVQITAAGGGGNGGGGGGGSDAWTVRILFPQSEFEVKLVEFDGILLVEETYADGRVVFGIGMEVDGTVFWLDVAGSLYYGTVDHAAGTMQGVVFNVLGGSSVWFAEK